MEKDLEDHEYDTQAETEAMAKATTKEETTSVHHDTNNKISKMDILDNANSVSKPTASDDVVAKPKKVDSTLEEDGILKETLSPGKQEETHGPFDCEAATVAASTVAEPLILERDVRQRQQVTRPGAYLGAPGEDLQRTTTLNYDLVNAGMDTSTPMQMPHITQDTRASGAQLARANLVEDDDTGNLMHANPVDLEAAQRRQQERKSQQQFGIAALIWLLLVLGIIVGFVVGTQKQKKPEVIISTGTPTAYGSMEPSQVPTSAPTGVLDWLLDNLPDYTLASINNGSETPQWKAWNWLANHQNVTFLPEWRKMQLFALSTFFYAFEGENWNPLIKNRWMDETTGECEWFSSGFGSFFLGSYWPVPDSSRVDSCDGHGQFTSLWLTGLHLSSGLTPVVPPEIELLTSLSRVALENIDIAMTLSDMLPTTFYEMSCLTSLSFGGDQLKGSIPTVFYKMTSLVEWSLLDNQLTGTIATELAMLDALVELRWDYNQFTGQIPPELGQMTALEAIYLGENDLSGQIPTELGLLTALTRISLRYNLLTGQIPTEIWQLSSLKNLLLDDNGLTGQIATEFGQLSFLKNLGLSQNQFKGKIPSELGLLSSMREFATGKGGVWVGQNQLTGQLPTELGQLFSLRWLFFQENELTGQIPANFWSLTNLWDFHGFGNSLGGSIPSDIGLLTSLVRLDLSSNLVTGTLPSEVGFLSRLNTLMLQNNSLTGTLPQELNSSGFSELRLEGNEFSGTVPEHLCSFLWCDYCSTSDSSPVSTCADLQEIPGWPGRFPPMCLERCSSNIVLNIQIDGQPVLISWGWQEQTNVAGVWSQLEGWSGKPIPRLFLHSFILDAAPNTVYRLVVSDSGGDGLSDANSREWVTGSYPGWITLTAANETVLFSLGNDAFSELTVDVLVGPDGSVQITNTTTVLNPCTATSAGLECDD
ncbi:expressed unknown protein [Seminavis robusta]|uniref:Uncharacterized protein n=1 Tax=Seminavis robusta TaxID=568900 RepID=A0A9N8HML3_9STRA|nr:expressed unknown protein [Seminavis robusta]|eukprot:Sro1128_g244291.1  (933) ;mRNA; r:19803-22601